MPCALLFVALALSTKPNIAIMIAVSKVYARHGSLHRQKRLFNNVAMIKVVHCQAFPRKAAAIEPMEHGEVAPSFLFLADRPAFESHGERPAGPARGD